MPCGIKHYYTSETLLYQRGLTAIGFNSEKRFESEADKEKVLFSKTASFPNTRKDNFMLITLPNISIFLHVFLY